MKQKFENLKKGKSEENRYDIGFMWQDENSMVAGH